VGPILFDPGRAGAAGPRIVLLAADGAGTNEIVHMTGVSKPTVIAWQRRYAAEGIGGWRTGSSRDGRGGPMTWRSCWPGWSRRRSGWA
jgi:Winged helix-turn helix